MSSAFSALWLKFRIVKFSRKTKQNTSVDLGVKKKEQNEAAFMVKQKCKAQIFMVILN